MALVLNTTNDGLFRSHKQHEAMQGHPTYFHQRSKITEWYRLNGLRIETIIAEQYKLNCEFHETDEDGKLKFSAPDENGNMLPILKEGKTKEEYEKAFDELMEQPNVVTWP